MMQAALKLLIVDDSTLVVERLAAMIGESNAVNNIYSARNFSEAAQVLSDKKPDIVLLDIHLPGKNGIELLQYIKQQHPKVVTVMLTNQTSENYRIICERMGSDHFIDKSTEFEYIPGIIEEYAG